MQNHLEFLVVEIMFVIELAKYSAGVEMIFLLYWLKRLG